MRIKKLLIVVALSILPFALGFALSSWRSGAQAATVGKISENHSAVSSTDRLTISSSGDIINLDSSGYAKVVAGQSLIDPVWSSSSLIAVAKSTNFSQINLYDSTGSLNKKLFDGSSKNIDFNKFATDPATSSDGTMLAYVSDKNHLTTGVPDNALFVENLATARTQLLVTPFAYTGGISTPRFDPANPLLITFTSYQYDSSQNPVSFIMLTNSQTKKTSTLTTATQNAYQQDFSPDGTKIIFLSRHDVLPQVTLTIADFDGTAISNAHDLYTGQIAYPRFSFDGKSIYFLQSVKNSGFDLFEGVLSNASLKNIDHVTSGSALNGDSSYEVTKK